MDRWFRVGASAVVVTCVGAGLLAGPSVAAPDPDYAPVIARLTTDITTSMEQNGVVGLTIALVDGDRVVIGQNGVVTAAVNSKDLTLVG